MLKPIQQALDDLDRSLLRVIREGLAENTVSRSSVGEIVTGNAYQSVLLRGQVELGFRQQDAQLLAGVSLVGRRFVDLGCNLGEHARLAAASGAAYVEGIDYEPFFVRIGNLINVYNGTQNVLLRQGDVAEPGCLAAEFDVGACFSSFVYVERNLEELLSRLRDLFLLETHALDGSWYNRYIPAITRSMPHWMLLGFTDQDAGRADTRRALIAFGRNRETVELVAINRSDDLSLDHRDVRMLDVPASRRAWCMWGDARRTKLLFREMQAMFAGMKDASWAEIVNIIRAVIPSLSEMIQAYNLPGMHFGTDRYWLGLFKGLVAFVDEGALMPDNPYLSYLRRLSESGDYDSGMAYELADEARAIARLTPRLGKMLEVISTKRIDRPLLMYNPLPVASLQSYGYSPSDPQADEHVIFTGEGGEFRAQFIDGNHRLAALWLGGAEACPVLPVWTNVFGLDKASYNIFEDAAFQDSVLIQTLSLSVLRFPPRVDTG